MSRPSNLSSDWGDFIGGDVAIIAGQVTASMAWKPPVRVAATADVDITALGPGDTIDGVVVAEADRVLLPSQTDATENGIYLVPASGTAVRADDMDDPTEFPGAFVPVTEGSAYAGKVFRCTNVVPPELTVDDVLFELWPSPAAVANDSMVPYYIAPGTTFTVPEFKQAPFAMLIDNEGTLAVDGFLLEVD